jgi:hypothetical protein
VPARSPVFAGGEELLTALHALQDGDHSTAVCRPSTEWAASERLRWLSNMPTAYGRLSRH